MGEDAGLGCGGFWGSGNPVVFSWWLHNSVNLLNSHGTVHFRAARTAPHSSQSVNPREQCRTNGCSVPGAALAPSGGPLSTVWQAGLGLLT